MDNKELKICYVSNYLPGYHSHTGGAEQAIFNTANLMKEKSVKVSFLTLPAERGQDSDIRAGSVMPLENFIAWGKKYIEIAKWYIFQFDPFCYFLAKKYFKQTKPDIVHFGNFQFITFGAVAAAKRLNIPVVMSIYDYWCFCPLTTLFDCDNKTCRKFHGSRCVRCLPRRFRAIQVFFLIFRKKIFNFFLKKVDKFIVLSESSRQILSDYGIRKEKVNVIRLSLPNDFKEFNPKSGPTGKSILFAGWLQKRKGLHVLLDAMSTVWKKIPDAKLYIVCQKAKWEERYEDLINSKLKEVPRDKYILLLGEMKRRGVGDLIRSADIVVIPEQWENMSPLFVIEAMSMSKPVVGSNIGGIPELIEDGKDGLLADYSNPADFAEKIATLLNNRQMREILGMAAGRKIKQMLNKEAISDQYMEVYKTL